MASPPRKRSNNVWAITTRDFSEISFKWTIERFSLYPDETEDLVESPLFGGDGEDESWRLQLFPGGNREECKGFVSLHLLYIGSSVITVDFEMKIEDANGKLVDHVAEEAESENSFSHSVFEADDGWGYCKFIERKKLFGDAKDLLPNDTLTVVCRMKVYADPIDRIEPQNTAVHPVKFTSSRNLLADLYDTKKMSDITFIVKDMKIPAHKCVLVTCSTVFDAMLSNAMKERESNEVKIDDVEEDVFTEMLRFIYKGKVENSNVMAADLLSVADKYDLKDLKDFSQQEILKSLSVETAAKYLVLADLYTSDLLKQETIEFIARKSAAVIKTDGWKLMVKSYPHLTAEIFEYLYK